MPDMSLGDYFAAAALQGMLSSFHADEGGSHTVLYWCDGGLNLNYLGAAKDYARISYEISDAMLAEREKRDQ